MLKSTTSRAPVIFALLLAAACLLAKPVRADDTAKSCLSGPNAAAPSGKHWYYHRDRKANRLCWYLGPLGKKVHARPAAPGTASTSSAPTARPTEEKTAAAAREAAIREAEAAFIAGPAAASPAMKKPTLMEQSGPLSRALGLNGTPSYVVGEETRSSSAR